MKSETQLLQEENEARQEAAKWRIAFDRSVKDKDRHVVLGGFFGAFFLAAHVSYAMAVTIGAA
jgi:hypothetical protein